MESYKENTLPLVLIVDDNPKNIQVVGNILRDSVDCEFAVAANGTQALESVANKKPNLILLDIMMPVMDGFETCEKLKSNPATADIPLIFLSAKSEVDDIVKGFELGAVDYVTKPFNPAELIARVKTQLVINDKNNLILQRNAEQKELLHVLCHDLANPFASIMTALEVIDNLEKFEIFKPELDKLAKNGIEIIELIRKMRKLEDKEESLYMEECPLNILVDESEMILKNRFQSKDITFEKQIPDDLMVKVETTSFVNSVLNNLLTNAVKFSQKGSVITVNAENSNDDMVYLAVSDRGIGMSEKIVSNLFEVDKSVSRTGTEGEMGTGFGMPLVKKFMKAYGGDIKIESKDIKNFPNDHGTTVTLSIPKV